MLHYTLSLALYFLFKVYFLVGRKWIPKKVLKRPRDPVCWFWAHSDNWVRSSMCGSKDVVLFDSYSAGIIWVNLVVLGTIRATNVLWWQQCYTGNAQGTMWYQDQIWVSYMPGMCLKTCTSSAAPLLLSWLNSRLEIWQKSTVLQIFLSWITSHTPEFTLVHLRIYFWLCT